MIHSPAVRKFMTLTKERNIRHVFGGLVHILAVEICVLFERRFDRKHHVETCNIVRLEEYDIEPEKKEGAVRYQPTPVAPLRSILGNLDIDHARFTFVDIGSGKGRVLLLASEFPYKKIIGVEISHRVHRVAERNFATWKNRRQRCRNLQSICTDAGEYRFPEDPLVLFFFTPFTSAVLARVIDNLKNSMAGNPRPVHIVYFGSSREWIDFFQTLHFTFKQIHRPIPFLHYGGYLFSSPQKAA